MLNKNLGLFLSFLIIFSLPILIIPSTVNATNEGNNNILTLVLKGGAIAEIQYQNNVTVPVYNSTTIPFNGTIKLFIHVPHPGLILIVNGTKYYSGEYNTTINESTTIYADAIQIYDEVSINLIGNGSVNVLLYGINGNESTLALNKSTSFKVDNETFISLSSNKLFTVNNDNLTTKYFAIITLKNVTINVDFNTQNISTSNLARINLAISGKGLINVFIDNISAYETLSYNVYNQSTIIYAPLSTTVYITSPFEFKVNDQIANLTQSQMYAYVFNITQKNNNTLAIVFITPNITKTNSTVTITKTFTEIQNQTVTLLPTNNKLYQGIIDIILVAIIVFLVTYIILKERKRETKYFLRKT